MARKNKPTTTREMRYIVQPYVLRTQRGRAAVLAPADSLPVRDAVAAKARAEKLYATGRYAGVDAYSVTQDEEGASTASLCFMRGWGGCRSMRGEDDGRERRND